MSTETNVTAAEELRAAATKIREIAGKATPGPWVNLNRGDRIVCANGKDGDFVYVVDEPLVANPDNGAHIALWHPGVAMAIAGWLYAVAIDCVSDEETYHHIKERTAALDIARAINGGTR